MKCIICKTDFVPKTNHSQMCSKECRKERSRQIASKWYEANRERVREERNKRSKEFRENETLRSLYNNARNRALAKGIPFTIDYEDLNPGETCPILGTPFIRKTRSAMSIDKINPALGYVKGNVQVISRLANVMKNDATAEELKKFANWINRNYP